MKLLRGLVLGVSGLACKFFGKVFVQVHIYHQARLLDAIQNRHAGQALITFSNHASCIDDPFLWSMVLPWNYLSRPSRVRWSLGAREICFTNPIYSAYFHLGQVIPIDRGLGLQQKGVIIATEKIKQGDWVHIFPESKVNQTKVLLPFRWGIGQLMMTQLMQNDILSKEKKKHPLLIPIRHNGLQNVLPENTYLPKLNQRVDIIIGEPIHYEHLLEGFNLNAANNEEKTRELRIQLTQLTYTVMSKMEKELEKLEENIL